MYVVYHTFLSEGTARISLADFGKKIAIALHVMLSLNQTLEVPHSHYFVTIK
jgi:hypothetical protein